MLKKKRLITLVLIVSIMILTVLPAVAKEINIQSPTVPAALPFLWMEEKIDLPNALDLNIKLSSDHKRGISLLAKNDIDFLITGTNVGANAYNRGVDIKLINVNTWGIDYLLTNSFKAESWQDLKNKDLVLPLKGGPLDFLVRYLAEQNGLNPDRDLNLVYRSLPGAAQLFMAGKSDAIVLPEPLVTLTLNNSKNAVLSMDIQKEWAKIHNDPRIPFVALFASTNFVEEYPQFTKIINAYYKKGVDWVKQNPEAAAELAAKHFSLPAPILKESLNRVELNIYSKQQSRDLTEIYFLEIFKVYPELLGGSLTDEEFYY